MVYGGVGLWHRGIWMKYSAYMVGVFVERYGSLTEESVQRKEKREKN